MIATTMGAVLAIFSGAGALGSGCGQNLTDGRGTYEAFDPTEAATLRLRERAPAARVVWITSRDVRDAWRVTLTVRDADATGHATFEVTDNHDGTLDVRDLGAD